MPHSLDLGPEAGVNSTMAVMRLLERPAAPLDSGEELVPGVFLNFDPETRVEAIVESRPGTLLSTRFTVEGTARWLALHIELGAMDLTGRMLLGLACRTTSPDSTTFRPCLRSATEDGFFDTFFRKTVVSFAEPSLHLDGLLIEAHPDLLAPAPWRELVLFFRPVTGAVDLQDLRVFVI